MVASESGSISTSGIGAPGTSTSSRWSHPAGSGPTWRTTIARIPRPSRLSPTRSTRSRSQKTTRAPESSRPYSISGPVHHAFSETATAPIEVMAAKASIHSG